MNEMLRKLQIAETEMLGELVSFFEENNIQYFALAGTFLGAVRHKGFVPWDDDIDLGIPREDYEKLIEIVKEKKVIGDLEVHYYPFDHSLDHYPLRIVNKKVIIRRRLGNAIEDSEAWITLFPLDGMPDNNLLRFIHSHWLIWKRIQFVMARYQRIVNVDDHRYSNLKRKAIILFGKLRLYRLFDEEKTFQKMDHDLKKYSFYKSKYVFTLMGGYKLKELFNKSVFGEGKPYSFEDLEINGPVDYDSYLKQIYGDYMTPPPIDSPDRNHHNLQEIIFK